MPRLSNLTSKQVIKLLIQAGFQLDHTTGSHYIFYHPSYGKRVVVPFHSKNLPKGTLHAILKQAGLLG